MNKNMFFVFAIMLYLTFVNFEILKAEGNENKIEFRTNLEEAFRIAKQESKHVLVYFSGSDWCRPCMQLQQEVFESSEFETFSKTNLVIVRLDFPAKEVNKLSNEQTSYNKDLAQNLNKKGVFPYMILFDSAQNQLEAISGYSRSGPELFIKHLKSKMVNE